MECAGDEPAHEIREFRDSFPQLERHRKSQVSMAWLLMFSRSNVIVVEE